MKREIRVSAPGKLILLGEHAVVYGKPAIIAAVTQRCFVTLTPKAGKEIRNYPAFIISKTLEYFHKKTPSGFIPHQYGAGFTLSINSQIPVGGGMGSSAALAVSIAGAVSLFLREKFDKEKINNIAYLSEQEKHGNPSGADNSACCYGGLMWFRKETPDLKIISQLPFSVHEKIAQNFLTIFTGTPKESTKEMVNMVGELDKKRPKFTKKIFDHQESLVRELLPALKKGDEEVVINCVLQGEKNLELLGVVSPFVKSLIRKIEEKGGSAKICGAGGKTKGTGILLAYHKNRKELETLLQSLKIDFSPVALGAEGVRQEL
jgi:mevalonate kinase